MTALRMALDPSMQQVVEIALEILPKSFTTPDQFLDQIAEYVRAKRNIALNRVAIEERRLRSSESFDVFFIGLGRLADATNLCGTCSESRMANRIMAEIRDSKRRKKYWRIPPFRHCSKRLMYVVARNQPVQMSALSVTKQASQQFKVNIDVLLLLQALHLVEPLSA